MLLHGKVILVTGAGQGLGAGIARAIAEDGARVVVTDLRLEDAERTARELEGAIPLSLDVRDRDDIQSVIEQVASRTNRLDGWVNNAGVITMDSALELSHDDWTRHFEVNVTGLFECCRLFAQHVTSRQKPELPTAIVNIASNAGKVGYGNMAAYNASKAAVINLTRSLATEWAGHQINVNAVCPGGVDTTMLRTAAQWVAERVDGDVDEVLGTMTPHQLGRHIQPIEVGRIVSFLLSDRAHIIRGQSINVDGGDTPY